MSLTSWALAILAVELCVFAVGIGAAFANRPMVAAVMGALGMAVAITLAWLLLLSESARAAEFPLVCVPDTSATTGGYA